MNADLDLRSSASKRIFQAVSESVAPDSSKGRLGDWRFDADTTIMKKRRLVKLYAWQCAS